MNWDELFEDRLADAGHLAPAIDEAGDHVTLVEAPVGEVELIVREALLSDETVERAAEGMQEAADHFGHYTPWTDLPEHVREDWRKPARAAITALIGDD